MSRDMLQHRLQQQIMIEKHVCSTLSVFESGSQLYLVGTTYKIMTTNQSNKFNVAFSYTWQTEVLKHYLGVVT